MQKQRNSLNPYIDNLVKIIVEKNGNWGKTRISISENIFNLANVLHYVSMELVIELKRMLGDRIQYWVIAMISGVFCNIAFEINRRLGSLYKTAHTNMGGVHYNEMFIDRADRNLLCGSVKILAANITLEANDVKDFAGLINYSLTTTVLRVLTTSEALKNGRSASQQILSSIERIFKGLEIAFNKEIATPYEDTKITENGDLKEFEKLIAQAQTTTN